VLHRVKRRPRARKRTRADKARQTLNKSLQAREALILELNQTENLKEYDFLIGLLHEVEAVEGKAKKKIKETLRGNK